MIDPELWERFRTLRRRPKLRAEVRAAAEQAVRTTQYGTAKACWIPVPPLPPPRNQAPPVLLDAPRSRPDHLAGLDSDGRPVLVRYAMSWGGRRQRPVVQGPDEADDDLLHSRVLVWDGRRLEVIGFISGDAISHVTWIDHDDRGDPVRWQTAGLERNDFGKGWTLTECDRDGGRPTEIRSLEAAESGRPYALRYEAEYAADGLARVQQSVAAEPPADLRTLPADEPCWDRGLHAHEPDPMAPERARLALAEPIAAAARRAVQDSGVADPWLVTVHWASDDLSVHVLGLEDARLAVRRREPEDVMGGAASWSDDLLHHLGPEALRPWRSLAQLRDDADEPEEPVAQALQEALARIEWPGGALAMGLIPIGDRAGLLGRVRAAYGDRYDAALDAVAGVPKVPEPAATRLRDRADVLRLLDRYGLPAQIADQARWGCALLPGGKGRSRLGGRPLVPPGTAWPTNDGVCLTHLASLDLAELPDHPHRGDLPAAGVIALFFDISDEAIPDDDVPIGRDDVVRLVVTPAGTPVAELPPPRRGHRNDPRPTLRSRRIRFEPVLTLPSHPEGLPAGDVDIFEDVYVALAERTPGLDEESPHLLGGHPEPVQWHPRAPGEASLLQLGWDERLGFEYLDGGTVAIVGAADDVAAGRWNRLRLVIDSG